MTIAEIMEEVKAYQEEKEDNIKTTAALNYKLADLIGASVATLLDSKNRYPSLNEAYPELFPTDEELEEKRKVEKIRAQMMAYATAHNKKMGGKKPNDNRRIKNTN